MARYLKWLQLMNLLQFLRSEAWIEQETYENAVENLMAFKDYALENLSMKEFDTKQD